MVRQLARLLVLLTAAWAVGLPSWAQAPDVRLAPSPSVSCLTPATAQRGEPEYPIALWKRGEGGRVLVELIFTGSDLRPEVKVIESTGDSALVDAVKTHVSAFRVPCFDNGQAAVRLRQDFVFTPDVRKAVMAAPADLADPARRAQLKCMAAKDGSKHPVYPTWASRAQAQGSVLALLKFSAPDQPPQVVLHAHTQSTRRLAEEVGHWAQQLRMPCLQGEPVTAQTVFKFMMEGSEPVGFKNIGFLQFLRKVKDLDRLRADFDTVAMGCPFDVRLTYFQPFVPNSVALLGEPDLRRRPLLEWLTTLTLDLSAQQMDAVLGDTVTLSIPCLKLNLEPKEKS